MAVDFLTPQWSAPSNVKVFSTLRRGGVSQGCYDSLNLGVHVGDDVQCVQENRRRLQQALNLPSTPVWLTQVHGKRVVSLSGALPDDDKADASYSETLGVVCAVQTADCLPVVFTNRAGSKVAVAHAGWRGLAAGVLEATIQQMNEPPEQLIAWLGPAIGPSAFEVGDDVVTCFVEVLPEARIAFKPSAEGKWLADIYSLARQSLHHAGLRSITGGEHCTYVEDSHFFSYRRSGVTGRMATLAWLER